MLHDLLLLGWLGAGIAHSEACRSAASAGLSNNHRLQDWWVRFHNFISAVRSCSTRSAAVAETTSAVETPGAVSNSVARPPGKPITAISVTRRSIERTEVSGSEHCLTTFGLPLAVCCIATITRF